MDIQWGRLFLFITIMTGIVVLVGGTTTAFLYSTAMVEKRERLVETAKSQARLIEAVARFDNEYSSNYPEGTEAATLSQISEAHRNHMGFGMTGEFILARREGDRIVFLLKHRHSDLENPLPVALDSGLAEPMKQALLGRSGTIIGLDYRGETVLAAYEPVAVLNLGLVVKIDLAEIRKPFIKAGLLTIGFAVLAILAGTALFFQAFHFLTRTLRKSEQRLNEAQLIARIGHWTLDPATGVVEGSDELFRIFDLTREEATLQAFADVVHDDDREYDLAHIQRGIDHAESWNIEHRIVRKDGSVRIVNARGEPITDNNGKTVELVGTIQDITERKRAEEELREGDAIFRGLAEALESISDGFSLFDENDQLVYSNSKMKQLFGSVSNLLEPGVPFTDLIRAQIENHPLPWAVGKEEQYLAERLARHINPGDPIEQEFDSGEIVLFKEYRTQSGGFVSIRTDITELKHREKELTEKTQRLLEEIAERQRAEDALRESEEKYRNLIEGSIQGIAIIQNLILKFANQSLADIYGYESVDSILGQDTLELFIAPHEMERIKGYHLARMKGEKAPNQYEFQGIRKDGTMIWLEGLATMVEWNGLPAALLTYIDISERKNLEEQLRHSQKLEAIGQLAGGVAHEFNNMLQIIHGYTTMAMSNIESPEMAAGYLEHVNNASERAAGLTAQLLAFGRKQKLETRHIDINDLISNQIKMLTVVIGENIEFEFKPSDNKVLVTGDPGMLEQVLLNICINARDAMSNSGRLMIETNTLFAGSEFCQSHPWATSRDYSLISIHDTGSGIDPEIIDHIFEPFYTTKEVGKGSGLGLSMVYGIIQLHGGMIEVESDPGTGTTFHIYLPAASERRIVKRTIEEGKIEGGPETILVAEDEEEVLLLATELLEGHGYTVLKARNGAEALREIIRVNGSVDLAIIDVVMPKMGGWDLYKEIAKTHSSLPVIFCTGYDPERIEEYPGFDHEMKLIRKPYSPNHLLRMVRDVLDERPVID